MSTELLYFVTLKHGNSELNCWVDKKVAVGNVITLKNYEHPDWSWRVLWCSEQAKTKEMLGGQRGWNVGGL